MQSKMKNDDGNALKHEKDGKEKRDKVDDLGSNIIQVPVTTDMRAADSKKKTKKRIRDKDLIDFEENSILRENSKIKIGDEGTEKKKKRKKIKKGKIDYEEVDVLGSDSIPDAKTRKKKEVDSKKLKLKKRKRDQGIDDMACNSIPDGQSKTKKPKFAKDGTKEAPGNEKSDSFGTPTPKSKRVSFKEGVDVFEGGVEKGGVVRGKRYTPEEDELIKDAVLTYIENHNLGEDGLNKVLNCSSHREVRHCWKEITSSLPWRPHYSVYFRAHILFERGKTRSWTEEEYELVRKHSGDPGSKWKQLAIELGKVRYHVKDAWRRSKLANMKKGQWSQEEYQTLFDLVNMDLKMKAFCLEPRKYKHGMLRDNISWGAISDKLSTRQMGNCCLKWYKQLSSPLVAKGLWDDSDDYRLLDALYKLDYCCCEDVEWEKLVENRCGDVCRDRWRQMVKHLGENANKPFAEQVEVLSMRYCPELLESKLTIDSLPMVP